MNEIVSHPSWVRGLKPDCTHAILHPSWSHPSWVRGLKPQPKQDEVVKSQSHPSWVRGLKHFVFGMPVYYTQVAPLVGAWIETAVRLASNTITASHPSWVRGLKLKGKS